MTVRQYVTVTGSQKTQGPGIYNVVTTGVTITLETWRHWPDATQTITVKDATGSETPNITLIPPNVVGGAIDGGSSLVIQNSGEAITLSPGLSGITWSAI